MVMNKQNGWNQSPGPQPEPGVVWPGPEQGERLSSGFELRPTTIEELAALDVEPDYVPSRWEERFDMCEIDAILHMLHHLTRKLPGFARRWVLRYASKFPRLHGHFGPLHGNLAFHAEESPEAIGMSACWRVNADGTNEVLW